MGLEKNNDSLPPDFGLHHLQEDCQKTEVILGPTVPDYLNLLQDCKSNFLAV